MKIIFRLLKYKFGLSKRQGRQAPEECFHVSVIVSADCGQTDPTFYFFYLSLILEFYLQDYRNVPVLILSMEKYTYSAIFLQNCVQTSPSQRYHNCKWLKGYHV